jgi:hypothetical protein
MLAMARVVISNPWPLVTVHDIPVADDWQRKGPAPVADPAGNRGVSSPALPRHFSPVHFVKVPSTLIVTDRGGAKVSQKTCRNEGPSSISQLIVFLGEKNSPLVAVCNGSVTDVVKAEPVRPWRERAGGFGLHATSRVAAVSAAAIAPKARVRFVNLPPFCPCWTELQEAVSSVSESSLSALASEGGGSWSGR